MILVAGLSCSKKASAHLTFAPGLRPAQAGLFAQVVGAIIASAVLYAIASGTADFSLAKGFAANGYGDHSPGKYSLVACLIAEVVLTMMFLFIIMGSTHGKAPAGFAPIAIGLGLTLIHLISIPVTNTSVKGSKQVHRMQDHDSHGDAAIEGAPRVYA